MINSFDYHIAQKAGDYATLGEAKHAIDAVAKSILEVLDQEKEIEFGGLGRFYTKMIAVKISQIPGTPKRLDRPDSLLVSSFDPSERLLETIGKSRIRFRCVIPPKWI